MSTVEIQDLTTFVKDIYSELVKETKELEKKHKTQKQEISTKIKSLISKENESEDIDIVSLAETIEKHKREKEDMDIQHGLDNHMLVKNTRTQLQKLAGIEEIVDTPEEIEKNKQAAREWMFNVAQSIIISRFTPGDFSDIVVSLEESRINKNVLRPEIAFFIQFSQQNRDARLPNSCLIELTNMRGNNMLKQLNQLTMRLVEIMFEPIE
tara:strand:- start:1491 stop:2120 length:630 start_codon:yes stop_codon:yes gene_type:complete